MDELIKKLQEKSKACGDKTKEDRARKGAYIDCIVELRALRKHAVSNSVYCDCTEKEVLMLPHSNTPYCAECGKNIKQ